ncbi:UNVERIFIED_CONTAM: uncharacterized protein DUF4349 [Acetivibrio alkalicellulosi]
MKIFRSLLGTFIIAFLILSVGCSSHDSGKSASDVASSQYNSVGRASFSDSYDSDGYDSGGYDSDVLSEQAGSTAIIGTGSTTTASINSILNERKIIRNAFISVEVDDFEKSYAKIEYLISNIGFVQESRISTVKRYINSEEILLTKGVIIIRVDATKFNNVLKDIKGLGLITEENITTDDVTEKFFDVESRLRLVRYQENRLEEYLLKVTDPDTIFKTESQLTEIRYEIERLTGTLNKLSDLVKLSTITINMEETLPYIEQKVEEQTYFEKLKSNFLSSFNGVINFCASFLIVLVAALPVLVLLSIIFAIVFFIYRFLKSKKKKTTTKNTDVSS